MFTIRKLIKSKSRKMAFYKGFFLISSQKTIQVKQMKVDIVSFIDYNVINEATIVDSYS